MLFFVLIQLPNLLLFNIKREEQGVLAGERSVHRCCVRVAGPSNGGKVPQRGGPCGPQLSDKGLEENIHRNSRKKKRKRAEKRLTLPSVYDNNTELRVCHSKC